MWQIRAKYFGRFNLPVPILILQFRVLHQLPLDHERLNVVDWVNVVHGVHHHLPHLLEALVRAQAGHSIALKSPSFENQVKHFLTIAFPSTESL